MTKLKMKTSNSIYGTKGKDVSIFLTGHRGMVGGAIYNQLKQNGYHNIIVKTHDELDLTDQQSVKSFFQNNSIEYVILAAAKVGGILANNRFPAEFIYQNLMIQNNIIHEAYRSGVNRLLFLGSSCIYPKYAKQPMNEEQLLSGYLEPTNESYAIAKIAGIKICESYNRQYGTKYRSVMPTNLYGPRDNFELETSHVLPAIIRKLQLAKLAFDKKYDFIEMDERRFGKIPDYFRNYIEELAKIKNKGMPEVEAKIPLWGTGNPKREFLHIDDVARGTYAVMSLSDEMYASLTRCTQDQYQRSFVSHINVGSGTDVAISDLAEIVKKTVGFKGQITWDNSKPDGTPRKLLDVTRLNHIGWKPKVSLIDGIKKTYNWYITQYK